MKYYRVKPYYNYELPTGNRLEFMLDYYGYENFLPKSLFIDLINKFFYEVEDKAVEYITPISEFDKKAIEFIKTIKYNNYTGTTPFERALNALKQLSSSIKLMAFEKREDVVPGNIEDNNIFNFNEDNNIFEELPNNEQLQKILKIEATLNEKLSSLEEQKEQSTIKRYIKDFSELNKVRKSEIVRPDFNFKLANKSINISANKDISTPKDKALVFIEDVSSSMSEGQGWNMVKAIQYLLMDIDKPIMYYKLQGKTFDFVTLISHEDKKLEFSKPKKYFSRRNDFNSLLKEINLEYSTGDVLIVTDGKDACPYNFNTKMKINTVSIENNKNLASICKKSGGKFIVI